MKGRRSVLSLTATQWILWSQRRRAEADTTRRRMIREGEQASRMVSELSCPGCDVSITVPTAQSGAVKFKGPSVTHSMYCTAAQPDAPR